VDELNRRLAAKNISLELTDAALDHAADVVVKQSGNLYGARPLRRWLEQNIITDLSRFIVAGEQSVREMQACKEVWNGKIYACSLHVAACVCA
jgi:ATP-dependent Clp protease ATP-binding subunit ClpA